MNSDWCFYLMPFGKYIDVPIVDVLQQDPSYIAWLCKQNWFQEKFWALRIRIREVNRQGNFGLPDNLFDNEQDL